MIIIAFARNTSKLLPRIFCRQFYHCALIIPQNDVLVMYQFTRHGRVARIRLRHRDIRTLGTHGWRFIYLAGDISPRFDARQSYTCVGMCKSALNLRAIHIQTPYALYQYLQHLTH